MLDVNIEDASSIFSVTFDVSSLGLKIIVKQLSLYRLLCDGEKCLTRSQCHQQI